MAEDNQQHEETPQVFAVERDIDGGWKFRRRDLLLGAALAAAGGALAGCGGNKKSTYATFKTPAPTLIPTYGPGDKAAACQNTWAHSGGVIRMVVSGDGQTLITTGDDSTIKLWSLPDLAWLRNLPNSSYTLINCLAANAEGTQVAVGYSDNLVQVWSIADGALQQTINTSAPTSCLLFIGDQIAMGDNAGTVTLWSLATGQQTLTLSADNSYYFLVSLALTPDGSILAAGDSGGQIYLWSMSDGALLKTIPAENYSSINTLAVSPDGTMLASGDSMGLVRLWMLPEGKLWHTEQGHGGQVSFLSTLPALKQLVSASGSYDVQIKFWGLPDGKLLDSWQIDITTADTVVLTPDGAQLIVGGNDGTINLWSVASREMLTCALDPQQAPYDSALLVGTAESGEMVVLPCGSDLPAGAVCTCNCVASYGFSADCGCVGYSTTEVCSCDRVCTCDTVCSCNSEGGSSSGGGGHYWHPN